MIPLRETLELSALMLHHAPKEIVCYSGIDSPGKARHYVDVETLFLSHNPSGGRENRSLAALVMTIQEENGTEESIVL